MFGKLLVKDNRCTVLAFADTAFQYLACLKVSQNGELYSLDQSKKDIDANRRACRV